MDCAKDILTNTYLPNCPALNAGWNAKNEYTKKAIIANALLKKYAEYVRLFQRHIPICEFSNIHITSPPFY